MKASIAFALIAWIALIIAGYKSILSHQYTAGQSATKAPFIIPTEVRQKVSNEVHTLFMFVHPRCPCSKASIYELSVLMTRCENKIKPIVVMAVFSNDQSGSHLGLIESIKTMQGLEVMQDFDGVVARSLGAATSGQVLLYHPNRRLAFKGGITGSRGHIGDNSSRDAIEELINRNEPGLTVITAPVYGCPLFTSE